MALLQVAQEITKVGTLADAAPPEQAAAAQLCAERLAIAVGHGSMRCTLVAPLSSGRHNPAERAQQAGRALPGGWVWAQMSCCAEAAVSAVAVRTTRGGAALRAAAAGGNAGQLPAALYAARPALGPAVVRAAQAAAAEAQERAYSLEGICMAEHAAEAAGRLLGGLHTGEAEALRGAEAETARRGEAATGGAALCAALLCAEALRQEEAAAEAAAEAARFRLWVAERAFQPAAWRMFMTFQVVGTPALKAAFFHTVNVVLAHSVLRGYAFYLYGALPSRHCVRPSSPTPSLPAPCISGRIVVLRSGCSSQVAFTELAPHPGLFWDRMHSTCAVFCLAPP